MNQYPGKERTNRPLGIALGIFCLLELSACGQRVNGHALAAPTTPVETSPATTPAAPTTSTAHETSCANLTAYTEKATPDGAQHRVVVEPADCTGRKVNVYNEQDAIIGQLSEKSEFDIICSAADTVNPTFKIHSDDPPLDGRVHLNPTIAAQEVTDYSLPNC